MTVLIDTGIWVPVLRPPLLWGWNTQIHDGLVISIVFNTDTHTHIYILFRLFQLMLSYGHKRGN